MVRLICATIVLTDGLMKAEEMKLPFTITVHILETKEILHTHNFKKKLDRWHPFLQKSLEFKKETV
jgi:hypothetical protein